MHKHKHAGDITANKKICPWWLSFILNNKLRKIFHNPYKLLNKFIKSGQNAADIGCGSGFFTIDIAKMVGDTGKVIAIDLQQKMLDFVKYRALKENIDSRIIYQKVDSDIIEYNGKLDFILLFYMIHEAKDIKSLFTRLKMLLKKDGIIFLCEPKFHVSKKAFYQTVQTAYDLGFKKYSDYKVFGSRTILLTA